MTVFETAAPTRLGRESNGMRMTVAEFLAVTDCDRAHRYELVHGNVIVLSHRSAAVRKAIDLLGYWLNRRNRPDEETIYDEYLVTCSSVRLADRVVWTGLDRAPRLGVDPPTIVIEIVSRSTRDRHRDFVEKRAEYAALGIAEYWVFDRFDRSLTVCFADGSETVVPEEGVYETDLLPGFELPLVTLLAAADRYAE